MKLQRFAGKIILNGFSVLGAKADEIESHVDKIALDGQIDHPAARLDNGFMDRQHEGDLGKKRHGLVHFQSNPSLGKIQGSTDGKKVRVLIFVKVPDGHQVEGIDARKLSLIFFHSLMYLYK